jgi:hypothetical protein
MNREDINAIEARADYYVLCRLQYDGARKKGRLFYSRSKKLIAAT